LQRFKLSRGYIKSVKPLVKCLYMFTGLVKLEISHIELSRLHFMAIDNYLVSASCLRTLKLVGVGMNTDHLLELSSTLEATRTLHRLNLSQNNLRNAGCKEMVNIIRHNKSLRKINVSRNHIKEEGILIMLTALKLNTTITCFKAEGNKFPVSRRLLAFIGNLVVYDNNCLERLQLGGGKHGLLKEEQADWD